MLGTSSYFSSVIFVDDIIIFIVIWKKIAVAGTSGRDVLNVESKVLSHPQDEF